MITIGCCCDSSRSLSFRVSSVVSSWVNNSADQTEACWAGTGSAAQTYLSLFFLGGGGGGGGAFVLILVSLYFIHPSYRSSTYVKDLGHSAKHVGSRLQLNTHTTELVLAQWLLHMHPWITDRRTRTRPSAQAVVLSAKAGEPCDLERYSREIDVQDGFRPTWRIYSFHLSYSHKTQFLLRINHFYCLLLANE